MKSAFNGGLQLSVLDGWWAEAYDGANGWALSGEIASDSAAQDAEDAATLHRLLGEEVVPSFYERDDEDVPLAWVERMRHSLRTLGPRFSATRMLAEYADGPYRGMLPTADHGPGDSAPGDHAPHVVAGHLA
jgi:starch phosphorylase